MDNNFINEEYYNNPYSKKEGFKINKNIIIGIAVIVLIIIVFFVVKLLSNNNSFTNLENKMVKAAIKYATKKGAKDKEIYIDSSKLNIDLPSDCNILSGVFYDNGKYTPYLVCKNYKSKKVNSEILNGDSIILLPKNSNYYELGYKSSDNYQISGIVDTSVEGVYNIYYIPSNTSNYETRKVVIIDNNSANNYFPTITFDDNIELMIGQNYESNLKASDRLDGDITNKVIKIDNVNTNEI